MAGTNNVWKTIGSFTVEGSGEVVRVGDTIMVRNQENGKLVHVANVEKIIVDSNYNINVMMQRYYRPEESLGGRKTFYGSKELFSSDHMETHNAKTVIGKCIVHTLDEYINLAKVDAEDFFCRFKYNPPTETFTPPEVTIFCLCGFPYNPDHLMVQCESCEDWFHPECIGKTEQEVQDMENFFCPECDGQVKRRRR